MAITGELSDFGLVNLIQVNCIEKRNARLTVNCRGKEAVIYFQNGEIAHAQYAGLTGTSAVHQALAINDGFFRLEEGVTSPIRTNKLPWVQVIMEGVRLLDEQRAHAGKRPLEERIVEDLSKVQGAGWVMVAQADGTVLAHSGLQTPERMGALVALFSAKNQAIGGKLKLGRSQHAVLTCSGNQIVVLYRERYIIALLLDLHADFEAFHQEANALLRQHFAGQALTTWSEPRGSYRE